jgi:hypothetical protein
MMKTVTLLMPGFGGIRSGPSDRNAVPQSGTSSKNIGGHWWKGAGERERRLYVAGYEDASGIRDLHGMVVLETFVDYFYQDPAHLECVCKECGGNVPQEPTTRTAEIVPLGSANR